MQQYAQRHGGGFYSVSMSPSLSLPRLPHHLSLTAQTSAIIVSVKPVRLCGTTQDPVD